MAQKKKVPQFKTVTYKSANKKRVVPVGAKDLKGLIDSAGQQIEGDARMPGEGRTLEAIYLMPQHNVLEVYKSDKGSREAR